ncbi:MAG: hypothetical protein U1E78_05810 [Gammaproteobacteria bacterium]
MKNLNNSEIQAISGGFVVEAAASAFLSSTLAQNGVYLLSSFGAPIGALEALGFVGKTLTAIAPFAGVAAYSAWHFSSDETKSEVIAEFNRSLTVFQS